MRPIAVGLIVAIAATGCATPAARRRGKIAVVTSVGIGSASAGVGMLMAMLKGGEGLGCGDGGGTCDTASLSWNTVGAVLYGGTALLIAGGIGAVALALSRPEPTLRQPTEREMELALAWKQDQDPDRIERKRKRDSAWTLTKQAAASARASDCAAVIARGRDVLALDPEFHNTVFVRDVGVAGCLTKAGIPTSIVAPPPRDPTEAREQAFSLTKTAANAARAGNCETAIKLQHQVRDLDAHVHDVWFVHDDAIKRCLDAASATAPVAPPVTPDARPAPPTTPLEVP